MLLSLFLSVLAASAPAPSSAPGALPVAQVEQTPAKDPLDADFDALQQQLRKATTDYQERRKTDPKTPRPEIEFSPKFQALADKGHGPSLLWLAQAAQHTVEGKKAIVARKLELYERVIKEHASKPWSQDIVASILREKKHFGMTEQDKLLSQLKNTSTDRETQAAALDALSTILVGTAAGESERKRAEEYKATLVKDYQGTRVLDRVNAAEFKKNFLVVGKPVPDFTAKDIEGAQFKLSDYKGKVVLLDFWGFW